MPAEWTQAFHQMLPPQQIGALTDAEVVQALIDWLDAEMARVVAHE